MQSIRSTCVLAIDYQHQVVTSVKQSVQKNKIRMQSITAAGNLGLTWNYVVMRSTETK